MAQMVRKQVYIEPRHEAILKRLARLRGVSEAEIIRQAIDREENVASTGDELSASTSWEEVRAFIRSLNAQGHASAVRDLGAWEREKAFITAWMAAGPAPGGRQWRREDAYQERLERYG